MTDLKTLPTHHLFHVQDRANAPAFWNKVGAAFVNRDGSHSVLIYQPGRDDQKALQLRAIDRAKFPIKNGADPAKSPTHELFLVPDVAADAGDAAKRWTRVGVAFTNRDGSLSLLVDDGDRQGPKARFQMRPYKAKEATANRAAA